MRPSGDDQGETGSTRVPSSKEGRWGHEGKVQTQGNVIRDSFVTQRSDGHEGFWHSRVSHLKYRVRTTRGLGPRTTTSRLRTL